MDPAAVTSPAAAGHPPRAPSPAHNYSNDVNQMPDSPPRRRGHRRAQSEIALRLPDEAAFERELGVEMPAFSDDGTEDLFSMYIDMEQMNTNYGGGAPSSNNALPPSTGHHSRSLSVDALSGFNKSGSLSTDVRRPRHQHSNSMDGSTSFDFEGSDGKKAMASAKLSEIALVDPKRAKRYCGPFVSDSPRIFCILPGQLTELNFCGVGFWPTGNRLHVPRSARCATFLNLNARCRACKLKLLLSLLSSHF